MRAPVPPAPRRNASWARTAPFSRAIWIAPCISATGKLHGVGLATVLEIEPSSIRLAALRSSVRTHAPARRQAGRCLALRRGGVAGLEARERFEIDGMLAEKSTYARPIAVSLSMRLDSAHQPRRTARATSERPLAQAEVQIRPFAEIDVEKPRDAALRARPAPWSDLDPDSAATRWADPGCRSAAFLFLEATGGDVVMSGTVTPC